MRMQMRERTGERGAYGRGRDKTREKRPGQLRIQPYMLRKKKCKFCVDKNLRIEYTDHIFLRKFMTERGKIISSRITGLCAKHQRKLAGRIKRARAIGLLPYVAE